MRVDQLTTVAREVTEVANLDGRDEAAPEQTMLQEFGDPAAILYVRLAPGHLFHVGRIDEQDGKVPFEQIENGLPVYARTLHGDQSTPLALEPRTHGQ